MRHGERKRRQTMKCLEATIRTVRSPRWLSGGEKTDVMCSKRIVSGTSLVVQWLRGHLAMLWVWAQRPLEVSVPGKSQKEQGLCDQKRGSK